MRVFKNILIYLSQQRLSLHSYSKALTLNNSRYRKLHVIENENSQNTAALNSLLYASFLFVCV